MAEHETVVKVEAGLDALLGVCADGVGARLLAAYFGDDPSFTGAHFDTVGQNPPKQFVGDDLAALSLLDVPAPRGLVADVLVHRVDEFNALLANVDNDIDLWSADVDQLDRAGRLLEQLQGIDGVGPVIAHKLIARKRPRLHPVSDRVVRRWFGQPYGMRYAMRVVLADDQRREQLGDALPVDAANGLHLLRRIDIAIWLLGASNHAAAKVRSEPGVAPPTGRT